MRPGRIMLITLLLVSSGCRKNVPVSDTTPLIEAVARGDAEAVRSCIARGDSINTIDAWGRTALGVAVRYGNFDLAGLLMAHNADVNLQCEESRSTPLHIAAEQGRWPMIKLLIARGAELDRKNKLGQTPVAVAMKGGHKKIVRLLVDHGTEMTIHVATYLRDTEAVKRLLENGAKVDAKDAEGRTALEYAARDGHAEIVQLLLARGADANGKSGGDTPLLEALRYRHPDVATLLVNHGTRVEGEHSVSGSSPLQMAAIDGLTELARLLIAKGAEVDAKGNSWSTPLHCAVSCGHRDTAELLVSRGADVNAKGCFSKTPLYNAAERGHKELVQWLVGKGAVVDQKNEFGQTPATCAMEAGHRDIVEFLAAHGADLTIHLAAYAGDLQTVGRLLDAGVNVDLQDEEKRTPLYLASQEGNLEVMKFLVSRGAHVNRGKGGDPWRSTPLHIAASRGRTDAVALLIRSGADVHAEDGLNATPLHGAAGQGHKDVTEVLIAAGAEVNTQDAYARTPLFKAALQGNGDIVELLLSKGADVKVGRMGRDITLPDPAPQTITDLTRFVIQAYAPYTVIVADQTAVRQFLEGEGMSFDDIWIPNEQDIQGLESVLKSSLEKGPPARRGSWLDAGYVLKNLAHYHREYSGFIDDDTKYVICQMVQSDEFLEKPANNAFSMIGGGGSGVVRVIFDAEKRIVVDVDGNAPY